MNRTTTKENDKYITSNIDKSIEKLGRIEDFIENIQNEQLTISKELELLRKENKMKSYKFRELLGQKFINNAVISKFEINNLM